MLSLWNRFGFAVIPNFTRNCPRSKERRAYTHHNPALQVFFNKFTKLIVTRFISHAFSKCIMFFILYTSYLCKSMGVTAHTICGRRYRDSPIRAAPNRDVPGNVSARYWPLRAQYARLTVGFAALTHGCIRPPKSALAIAPMQCASSMGFAVPAPYPLHTQKKPLRRAAFGNMRMLNYLEKTWPSEKALVNVDFGAFVLFLPPESTT